MSEIEEELRECKTHGLVLYKKYSESENKNEYSFRCMKCRSEYLKKKYQERKKRAIDYKGGKCCKCGYNKCDAALEFHHLDPFSKDITPSKTLNRSWDNCKKELDKCILVCSNCHREIHNR
jgi:hypothetical protein